MFLGYLFDWKALIRFLHVVMRFIHFVPFLCQTIFKPFFMSTHLMIRHEISTPCQPLMRFSFGSGEWRNGADSWKHWVPGWSPCHHVPSCIVHHSKEANEITSDAEGRWFSFNVSMKTVVIMERKTLPSHLQSLPFVDNPVELATVIRELEDAGEVKCWWIEWNSQFLLTYTNWLVEPSWSP